MLKIGYLGIVVQMLLKEPFKTLIYFWHSHNTHWKPVFSLLQDMLKIASTILWNTNAKTVLVTEIKKS